jgi:hypothetical protein
MFSGDRFIVNAVIDSGDAHSDSPRGAAASSSSSQRPPVPPPPLANGVGQVTGAALETRLIAYCEQNGAAFDALYSPMHAHLFNAITLLFKILLSVSSFRRLACQSANSSPAARA